MKQARTALQTFVRVMFTVLAALMGLLQEHAVRYPDYQWAWTSTNKKLHVRRLHRSPDQEDMRQITYSSAEEWQEVNLLPQSLPEWKAEPVAIVASATIPVPVRYYYPRHDPLHMTSFASADPGFKQTITIYIVHGSKRVKIQAHH